MKSDKPAHTPDTPHLATIVEGMVDMVTRKKGVEKYHTHKRQWLL